MEAAWKFVTSPEFLTGLVIAVVGTFAASTLPRLAKTTLLWFPKRFGRGLLGFLKEAANFAKASKDPTEASVYVGYNLALLTINAALDLVALGTIAVYQITDPGWASPYHTWSFRIACVVIVVLTYAVLKRWFYLALAYRTVFYPPETAASAKAAPVPTPQLPEQH
jgi:hypothetical protein